MTPDLVAINAARIVEELRSWLDLSPGHLAMWSRLTEDPDGIVEIYAYHFSPTGPDQDNS